MSEEVKEAEQLQSEQELEGDPPPPDPDEPTDEVEDEPDGEGEEEASHKHLELIAEAAERIQRASHGLEQAVNRQDKNPSDQNRKAVEKAQGRAEQATQQIDQLIQAGLIDRETADYLKGVEQKLHQGDEESQKYREYMDKAVQTLAQQQAQMSERQFRIDFAEKYPQIKGQYDEIHKAAATEFNDEFGDEELSDSAKQKLWNRVFWSHVREAEKKVGAANKGGGEKKPKATNTVKAKPSGARESAAGAPPGRSLAQIMYPDMG